MLGGIVIILIGGVISFLFIDHLKRKYAFVNARLLKTLYGYHLLLTGAYYVYVMFNPSDSKAYYYKVMGDYRGESWIDFYGTSTTFIEFIAYPFIRYLGFSYESVMALFSILGFFGFLYFYIFFRENIRFNHRLFGFNLITIIFFLPNLHFWSSSLGKGSIIFLGIGLFFFGISNIRRRILPLIIGAVLIYHIRPHVMLVILVSSILGFIFTTRGVGLTWRLVFLTAAAFSLVYIYQEVLMLVGLDEEQIFEEGLDMTHRATELTKATSGVDITSYNLPMKVFTFLYRPLFVDAPGVLGLIVSVENVFYLLITLMLFGKLRSIKFLLTGNFLIKTCFMSFITVTIALAQISGNLGLAMRQKSQIMILFLFVVVVFLDEQKLHQWRTRLKRNKKAGKFQEVALR